MEKNKRKLKVMYIHIIVFAIICGVSMLLGWIDRSSAIIFGVIGIVWIVTVFTSESTEKIYNEE